jgi:uncharacterized membrane protein
VLDENGVSTTIDVPGAEGRTYVFGINGKGTVVGHAILGNGEDVGFARNANGDLNTFMVPGAKVTQAFGINDKDQVVGTYFDGIQFRGFVLGSHGKGASIEMPGATYTTARGINDRGQIVGYYQSSDGWRGFRRDPDGTIITIDVIVPGGVPFETRLTGIDQSGRATGYSRKQGLKGQIGLVSTAQGAFSLLRVPASTGPEGTQAFGINDKGKIVGYFTDKTGSHGFAADRK